MRIKRTRINSSEELGWHRNVYYGLEFTFSIIAVVLMSVLLFQASQVTPENADQTSQVFGAYILCSCLIGLFGLWIIGLLVEIICGFDVIVRIHFALFYPIHWWKFVIAVLLIVPLAYLLFPCGFTFPSLQQQTVDGKLINIKMFMLAAFEGYAVFLGALFCPLFSGAPRNRI